MNTMAKFANDDGPIAMNSPNTTAQDGRRTAGIHIVLRSK